MTPLVATCTCVLLPDSRLSSELPSLMTTPKRLLMFSFDAAVTVSVEFFSRLTIDPTGVALVVA